MKQLEFNKTMVGKFYMQDFINKEIIKKLKDRGKNGKNENQKSVR